jgi:hypothetical protein
VPQPVFEISDWDGLPNDPDYGLKINPCWPSRIVPNDPGFALLTDDSYYERLPGLLQSLTISNYAKPPPANVIAGKSKYKYRRNIPYLDSNTFQSLNNTESEFFEDNDEIESDDFSDEDFVGAHHRVARGHLGRTPAATPVETTAYPTDVAVRQVEVITTVTTVVQKAIRESVSSTVISE